MKDKILRFKKHFAAETRERIQSINTLALELEKDGQRQDLVDKLKREMHTIKGGSRILGLKSISRLAHFFEDYFQQIMSGQRVVTTRIADRLFAALDLMEHLLEKEDAEETLAEVESFIRDFEANILDESESAPVEPGDDLRQRLKAKISRRLKERQTAGSAETEEPTVPPEAVRTEVPVVETPGTGSDAVPEPVAAESATRPEESSEPALAAGEARQFSFSRSFRVDSELIDAISDDALQLKVMTSFFNVILDEYSSLAQAADASQRELAQLVERMARSDNRDQLEMQRIQLRDLAQGATEKKKLIAIRINAFQRYFDSFYQSIEDLKLIPLATIFSIYPRFVRDYAVKNHKMIEFDCQGGHTRLDKRIAETINESLIHLLRNAVDHGIESPEVRKKAGKSPMGRVELSAEAQGDNVRITIRDDGGGFDARAIREQALKRKLMTVAELDRLSDTDLYALVFHPGFSTAPIITDSSGRGVGMDVVQHALKSVNGTIRITSESGNGTVIHLELPIAISTTRIIYIRDGEEVYAIPAENLEEIRRIRVSDLTRRGSVYYRVEENHSLQIAHLSSMLGFRNGTDPDGSDMRTMLTIRGESGHFGIMIDQALQEEHVIVHPKDPFIQNLPHISGISVNIFGEPFLVLDSRSLGGFFRKPTAMPVERTGSRSRPTQKIVLLVEDSVVTREMEKVILESAGFKVVEAVNGMDGLEKLAGHRIDCIVTDVEMPVMDGFSMTEKLREIPGHRETPVIIITTRENREDKIRGIQVGANAYITKKDFDQMRLIETISRLV